MRCFLFCFVVLLMMSTVVIGGSPMLKKTRRQLTGSSTETGRQTTQAAGAACGPRGAVGGDALGVAFHQVAQALQAAIRSQVRAAASELRLEQTVALSALRQDLEQRLQRLEETGGGRANAHSNEGSEVESRLAKLEGTVQRLLRHVPTEAPQEPLEIPSVVQKDPSPSAPVLTSPQPASGSAVAAAATEAPPSEEEMRRRVEFRVEELRGRISRGNDLNDLGEELCFAALYCRIEDVRLLLLYGIDANYTSSHGRTVLTSAASTLYESCKLLADMMSLILQGGADVNGIDTFGRTALHYAAAADEDWECLAPLIAAGADVNARDLNGETPLHWAAKGGKERALRKLLAAGADRNIKAWGGDFKDKTPSDIAPVDFIFPTSENS